jgi:NADH-ubiquinone oxidoreductase chain 5
MCAGVIIHTIRGYQDIRFMGGLSFQIPFTLVCLSVSRFALRGIPVGFYSRDLILEIVSFSYVIHLMKSKQSFYRVNKERTNRMLKYNISCVNYVSFFLFFVSTGLTVYYSFQLFYYFFCGGFNSSSFYCISESNLNMLCGIIGLMMVAVVGRRMLR